MVKGKTNKPFDMKMTVQMIDSRSKLTKGWCNFISRVRIFFFGYIHIPNMDEPKQKLLSWGAYWFPKPMIFLKEGKSMGLKANKTMNTIIHPWRLNWVKFENDNMRNEIKATIFG
jgi:hypothetical protein